MVVRRNSFSSSTLTEDKMSLEKSQPRRHSDKGFDSRTSTRTAATMSSSYSSSYEFDVDFDFDDLDDEDTKQVLFGSVRVMEFPREVGDNPSVTEGCPLTIGWKMVRQCEYDVDVYELMRPTAMRRSSHRLRIPSDKRAQLLLADGHSLQAIARSTLEALKIKDSRESRLQNHKMEKFRDHIVMTGHKIKEKVAPVSRQGAQSTSSSPTTRPRRGFPSMSSPQSKRPTRSSLSLTSPSLKSLRSPLARFANRKRSSTTKIPYEMPSLS